MSRSFLRAAVLPLALLGGAAGLGAQAAPAAPSTAQPAPAGAPAVQAAPVAARAGWFSDKRPLMVGDIVTIVVDETVNASERQSQNAVSNRKQEMGLNLNVGTDLAIGPQKGFQSGVNNNSRNTADAGRQGDLTAVISVRVVSIEPSGIAHLKGEKTVGVDGRNQVIQVEGVVRPEDVSSQNTVPSSRIAESVISYKGKKIGPAKGILGSILSIFWP
ncbi:MAG: flagellar basal body L-ring protein FlgH [Gemmatimonadetes bacterium]|jgi:flagellar L-ring protein precursor FlgH|nr:flagellar basal body L-ring protein FlgH [Gemmatimonadota bacterium]MBP6671473.1 flagellar basal body L-ring protein FlgH [Gemmatimonadales bacterium]MBK6778305.1 flagellar basal body L-ring protein FlgH [Gemmatimonadota bacterium]MBK7349386.1 flagellar basal body L-ring protein FlgH [Gemmatimonadota bacterium]MBK7714954.1 flagellar basal body L-ring protein FlgH [Gemmatimonadota bacterium]